MNQNTIIAGKQGDGDKWLGGWKPEGVFKLDQHTHPHGRPGLSCVQWQHTLPTSSQRLGQEGPPDRARPQDLLMSVGRMDRSHKPKLWPQLVHKRTGCEGIFCTELFDSSMWHCSIPWLMRELGLVAGRAKQGHGSSQHSRKLGLEYGWVDPGCSTHGHTWELSPEVVKIAVPTICVHKGQDWEA